jgi:Clp amino terminal domain, pathogenicity island component/UvrB/uvrC motif
VLRKSVSLGHMYIGSEHILLGLIREGSGLAAQILTGLGASASQIHDQVLELLAAERPVVAGPITPPGIREFDRKIGRARQAKDAAIDAGDYERAVLLRDQEKELMAQREQQIEAWSAGTDMAVLGRELERLRDENQRLQDLLLRHGIEPTEDGQQTA